MIQYKRREGVNYFTDFMMNNKPGAIRERLWYYDEHFISPELCDKFVDRVQQLNKKEIKGGGIHVEEGDTTYRNSDVFFLSNEDVSLPDVKEFHDTMISKTLEINNRIFNFDISHLMHSQFTQYKGEDKQHFNWHPDGGLGFETDLELMDDLIFRKLTTVVCLSDHTDYEHGDFILFDGGVLPEQAICLFKMTKGEAIIFPAFMMHKVNPVTSGKRISLVNWFCGPRWR